MKHSLKSWTTSLPGVGCVILMSPSTRAIVSNCIGEGGFVLSHCPDDNPQANTSSSVRHRAVLQGVALEKNPGYLPKHTASLAPDGLGRKPCLAHDHPLCSLWRSNQTPSTSAATHFHDFRDRVLAKIQQRDSARQLPQH